MNNPELQEIESFQINDMERHELTERDKNKIKEIAIKESETKKEKEP